MRDKIKTILANGELDRYYSRNNKGSSGNTRTTHPMLLFNAESRYLLVSDLITQISHNHELFHGGQAFTNLANQLLAFLRPLYQLSIKPNRADNLGPQDSVYIRFKEEVNYLPLLYQKETLERVIKLFKIYLKPNQNNHEETKGASNTEHTAVDLERCLQYANALQSIASEKGHPLPLEFLETLLRLAFYYKGQFQRLNGDLSVFRDNIDKSTNDFTGKEPTVFRDRFHQYQDKLWAEEQNKIMEYHGLEHVNPLQLSYAHQRTISTVFNTMLNENGIQNEMLLKLPTDIDSLALPRPEPAPNRLILNEVSNETLDWLKEIERRFFRNNSHTTLTPLHFSLLNDIFQHLRKLPRQEIERLQNKINVDSSATNSCENQQPAYQQLIDYLINQASSSLRRNFSLKFGAWLPLIINPIGLMEENRSHYTPNNYLLRLLLSSFGKEQCSILINRFLNLTRLHSNQIPNEAELESRLARTEDLFTEEHRLAPHQNIYSWVLECSDVDEESLFHQRVNLSSLPSYSAGIKLDLNGKTVKDAKKTLYENLLLRFDPNTPLHESLWFLPKLGLERDEVIRLLAKIATHSVPEVIDNNPHSPTEGRQARLLARPRAPLSLEERVPTSNWHMFKILFRSWCPTNRVRQHFARERLIESTLDQLRQDSLPRPASWLYPLSTYFNSPPVAVYRAVVLFGYFLFSYNIPAVQIKEDYYYKLGAYLNFLSLGSAATAAGIALGLMLIKLIYNISYDKTTLQAGQPEQPTLTIQSLVQHGQEIETRKNTKQLVQEVLKRPYTQLPISSATRPATLTQYVTKGLYWCLVTCLLKKAIMPIYRISWPILWGIAYYAPLYKLINTEVIPPACQTWFNEHGCAPVFKHGDPICDNLPAQAPLCPPENRFAFSDVCFSSEVVVNVLRVEPFAFFALHYLAQHFNLPSKLANVMRHLANPLWQRCNRPRRARGYEPVVEPPTGIEIKP